MDKKIKLKPSYKKGAKQIACAIIFLLFLNCVNAQDFKLAGIHYANYPKAAIKDGTGNQEVSFHEFGAFINFPKELKNDKTALINGFGYGYVEATMYNFPSLTTTEYLKKLQVFYYQLIIFHKWSDKWSLLVNLKPTVASDFEQKLSSDDLVFQGGVIAIKTINDKFKIGGGVVSSTRWGSPMVMPIVNLHYNYNRHNLNALLPMNLKYTYSLLPEEKLKLGLQYARNGADFNVYGSEIAKIDKINYSRANIGLTANYQLIKILRLEAYGGISTGRIFNLVDFDKNVNEYDSKAAPFFSVGLVLVSPKRK